MINIFWYSLTGTIATDYICIELVWFNRPRLGHVTLDLYIFFTLPLILYWRLKFLCYPHNTLTNLPFFRKPVSVTNSRYRIFTHLLPIVGGVALDVLGNREVQLFRYTNIGRFLLCS
jgi:hypothetical protein